MSTHDPLSDFVDNCCGDPNCTNDCERKELIPAHGVSPCFVNCGKPACQKLGCVRVYNADNGWMGE